MVSDSEPLLNYPFKSKKDGNILQHWYINMIIENVIKKK